MSNPESPFDAVAENAFRFLERAARELTDDTEMSVVHFAIGVELFLKARLIAEHWALVVGGTNSCRLSDLRSGKSKTIGLEELRAKIEGITETTELAQNGLLWKAIRKVADHRNSIVHSIRRPMPMTKEGINATAIEQLRAWRGLIALAKTSWASVFSTHKERMEVLDLEFDKHEARYALVYDDWQKTKPKGRFMTCTSCRFDALREDEATDHIFYRRCYVCEIFECVVRVECPECSETMDVSSGGGSCPDEVGCGAEVTLAQALEGMGFEELNGGGCDNGIHCGECYDTVSCVYHRNDTIICPECMSICEPTDVSRCEWCNEGWTYFGNDASFAFGCEMCGGRVGWRDD